MTTGLDRKSWRSDKSDFGGTVRTFWSEFKREWEVITGVGIR